MDFGGGPMEPMEPLRTTSLGDLWSAYGASWAEFNRCVVPSEFPASTERGGGLVAGATMDAYHHTRDSASLFDVSYKVSLRVTGADREFVADQFLTCNLRAMRPGDVQYACVLDSKGLILDDAFVYLTQDAVEILTSGCHSRQVADYLGHYVVYVRRTGADVAFEESHRGAAIALQGPKSCEALARALDQLCMSLDPAVSSLRLETVDTEPEFVPMQVLSEMPYMSALRLRPGKVGPGADAEHAAAFVLRVGSTGEDGFEIVAPAGALMQQLAAALLEDSPVVQPAGLHCLDMLRMEAGLPRVGTDILPGRVTPVRASLVWTLDQAKMRGHLMFGWQKLFFQLAKGPKFRRVALLLDGPGHTGCRLLSNPHRQPIGEITSTAWSPALQSRVAMAYVRPEYAKADKHILVTVPYNLPTYKMRSKAIKHWIRSGPLRSSYRKLVAACITTLPLVPHVYPEPARQRKAAARTKTFAPEGPATPASPSDSPNGARARLPSVSSRAPLGGGGGPVRRGGAEPAGQALHRNAGEGTRSDVSSM
mmetsp:Transcript_3929/g.11924  ORF Transcript_3929/g.11924 Transcript_3929/m.11924 type:complete len:537 (+) Transcript_3929:188-1798(+)